MKAEIVKKDKDIAIIEWSGKTGFGTLTINYDGRGGYIIDAECISIDTVIKIIKAIK